MGYLSTPKVDEHQIYSHPEIFFSNLCSYTIFLLQKANSWTALTEMKCNELHTLQEAKIHATTSFAVFMLTQSNATIVSTRLIEESVPTRVIITNICVTDENIEMSEECTMSG